MLLRTIEELPAVDAVGRDGPARGRRAARRGAGHRAPTACRRCSPSSPARCACCARSRAPSSTRSRTSTRCWSRCAAAPARPRRAVAGAARARRRRVRAPAQDARRLARAAPARRPGRSREQVREALGASSAIRRTRAPSASRREEFRALAGIAWAVSAELRHAARAGARRRSTSACSSAPSRDADGRHELVTRDAVDLARRRADARARRRRGRIGDEVVCPGVPGPPEQNLAARALREFRARTGWEAPPLRLTIDKRIPVAAGLAGGSADAAAALRLARAASGLGDERAAARASPRGSAPTCRPRSPRAAGWPPAPGERLERAAAAAAPFGVLVLPLPARAVDRRRLRRGRPPRARARRARELRRRHEELASALAHGAPLPAAQRAAHNDLQRAAVSLRRRDRRGAARARRGRRHAALVSGSGPDRRSGCSPSAREGLALARRRRRRSAGATARRSARCRSTPPSARRCREPAAWAQRSRASRRRRRGRATAPCATILR